MSKTNRCHCRASKRWKIHPCSMYWQGETISIVKDTPGVTRDRIYADCNWLNMNFTLVDTGGIEPDSRDIILSQMRSRHRLPLTPQMRHYLHRGCTSGSAGF